LVEIVKESTEMIQGSRVFPKQKLERAVSSEWTGGNPIRCDAIHSFVSVDGTIQSVGWSHPQYLTKGRPLLFLLFLLFLVRFGFLARSFVAVLKVVVVVVVVSNDVVVSANKQQLVWLFNLGSPIFIIRLSMFPSHLRPESSSFRDTSWRRRK
jgi:hypothetical protein